MRSGVDLTAIVRCARILIIESYRVTNDELFSRCRTARVAWARQVFVWLLSSSLNFTDDAIGRMINRNRSSVLHCRQTVNNARSVYAEVKRETDALLTRFNDSNNSTFNGSSK